MFTLSITTFAQSPAYIEEKDASYMCNPPLPYHPAHLNILFIGNSFSIDTANGAMEILKNMNVKNVNIYVLYKGACSLKEHYELFKDGKKPYDFYCYNHEGKKQLAKHISIRDAMTRFSYDIVVFQQYSLESGNYSTYEPYLAKLITAYKMVALAPRTTFAFNMTWAYSSKHKNISTYGSQEKMYENICNAARRMKVTSGIDVIIPCGTAVQNARHIKNIISEDELTRDTQHMSYYMGRYLLGCTFCEAILAPTIELDLRKDESIFGKDGTVDQVNNSNRELLKKCARLAVGNNFAVSEWVNE